MNGYVLFFFLYLLAGIFLCVLVFCWAVRNGQFQDQQRARYLPLACDDGLQSDTVPLAGKSRAMLVSVLLILGFLGIQVLAVLVMLR